MQDAPTHSSQLVDPRGRVAERRLDNAPRLETLKGVSIGFIDNKKINVRPYFEMVAQKLRDDWNVRETMIVTKENCSLPASEAVLQHVRAKAHAIITGVGD